MSDNDREDGAILRFPRAILPSSFDAPEPGVESSPADEDAVQESAPAGVWPRLPEVAQMRPPLHLTVPGMPTPEPASGDGEEGAFVPPAPADPDNPTASEVAATAMALVTALGVAAAQGMWHRARQRQALADQTRAAADKASAKAAAAGPGGAQATRSGRGAGSSGRSGGSTGSSLLSPSGDKKKGSKGSKGSRAFARRTGDGAGGSRPAKAEKPPRGPRKGPGPGGKSGRDSKGPRSARGGKADRKGQDTSKRRKRDFGWRRRATGAPGPGGKPSKPKRRAIGGKDPLGSGDSRGRKLTWKAPKGSGKGSGKGGGGGKGPKRWSGRTPAGGKDTPGSKRPSGSRGRRLNWKNGTAWLKRWAGGRTRTSGTPSASSEAFTETTAQESATPNDTSRADPGPGPDGRDEREGTQGKTPPPPPPPPGWERMRPPPAADRTVRVTVERVDERPWPRPEAAALTVGQAALAAGPAESPTARPAPSSTSANQQGAPIVSMPVARTNTQYADAELTIHDVIEADEDMATEIVDGVADAQATAEGCERLLTKLEALHAEVVNLRVPGVLEGLVVLLMEKTITVRAKALAIAENLPAAAEAISTAGSNAEARHKPLADAVRDAGHTRPAEREYHNE